MNTLGAFLPVWIIGAFLAIAIIDRFSTGSPKHVPARGVDDYS